MTISLNFCSAKTDRTYKTGRRRERATLENQWPFHGCSMSTRQVSLRVPIVLL